MTLSLEGTKGIALASMFVITLIPSLAPIYVRGMFLRRLDDRKAKITLSSCLCFGAGILMATVFLHILPEASETLEDAMDKDLMPTTTYPVPYISLCLGFFIVYFIEELVYACIDSKNQKEKVGEINKAFDDAEKLPHTHDHTEAHNYLKKGSLVGSLIVVVALSFYGIMEGMALGLEENTDNVWLMFVAICSHKIFIAFSMAMEMLEVDVNRKLLILAMLIFSLASPVGGIIGAVITANVADSKTAGGVLAPAFLQAISGGTILYVVFCEVLERERAKATGGLTKFFSLLLGFCIMAALQTLDNDGGSTTASTGTTESYNFTTANP